MLKYKKYIADEERRINDCLDREVAQTEDVVRPLADYVLQSGGKRLRPLLAVLTGKAFGCQDDDLYTLGALLELVHCATLIHDDVVDDAALRRGVPALHAVRGSGVAVLTGDVLLSTAMLIGYRLDRKEVMEKILHAVAKTASGAVAELQNTGNASLDFAAYMSIISGKTAHLFSCSTETGALFAGASPEQVRTAAEFGMELGLAFQIVDDALDISAPKDSGKPVGGDIREGKMTPPLAFYLDCLDNGQKTEFMRKFSGSTLSAAEIEYTVGEMRRLGCAEKTRELAKLHLDKAREELAKFPTGFQKDMLLDITEYLCNRKK